MKRFNNFRRMLLPVAALAAAIGLTLGGCTKVDDTLGGNLIPDNQQMRAGYVQLPRADELNPKKYVETRLFQTDSIVSSNITYGYMGSMLNDTLGHRSAGFLSQMVNYYKVDSGYFGYMPIFDSAQILLKVTSFGRDSVTEQSFAVYEVVSNKYLTEKPIAARLDLLPQFRPRGGRRLQPRRAALHLHARRRGQIPLDHVGCDVGADRSG